MKQTQSINIESTPQNESSFEQLKLANPCQNCEAPCCKMLLIPYQTPNTFMDLDYIRYMLGFPGVNMILHKNGTWQVQIEENCNHLNLENNLCKLHDSPQKPKTCSFFNPHNCFYKRNFTGDHIRNIIKINAHSFGIIVNQIKFDELGNIISIPQQELIERIVQESAKLLNKNIEVS